VKRGGGGRVGRTRRGRITNFTTPKMKASTSIRTNMFVLMNRRKEERTHFYINYVWQEHWTWLHGIVMMCCQFCIWWNLYEDAATMNWIYAIWDPLFTFKLKNHFNYMPSMRPRNYTCKSGTNCKYILWNMSQTINFPMLTLLVTGMVVWLCINLNKEIFYLIEISFFHLEICLAM